MTKLKTQCSRPLHSQDILFHPSRRYEHSILRLSLSLHSPKTHQHVSHRPSRRAEEQAPQIWIPRDIVFVHNACRKLPSSLSLLYFNVRGTVC
jgi:hypothetical protein